MTTPLAAVARLTDALSRALTLEAIYDAALDTLQGSLGVHRASILLFDEDDVMQFVAWRGLSDRYRTAVTGHTPWRPDSPAPEPITVEDITADPSLADYGPIFANEGIRALGFFPLIYRDRVIGKFMLYHPEPHSYAKDELELARTIAGQIAFGVARVRAEMELQRERDRLGDLVANVPGVVWEMTGDLPENEITFVSPQIEQLLGYTAEEWYANPSFSEKVILDSETIASGTPDIAHYRMRTRDGRAIWTEVRTARKQVEGKLVTRGVTIDITRQKEAEQNASFLSAASAVLASSLDYETTLAHVGQLVVQRFADWCTIDIREADGAIRRLHALHRDHAHDDAMEIMRGFGVERQKSGAIRRVIEEGQPILVPRIDFEDWAGEYRDDPIVVETFRALGFHSFMIVPLVSAGRSFGAIAIVSADPLRRFDKNDLELACELGRRAGYAVDNARLYREAQEANRAKDEFLATLSHELRTPMTATLGWSSMLSKYELTPENFRIAVETIERSTRAQAKLIDDILDVSRIVTGKLHLAVAPVNVRGVLDAVLDNFRPTLLAKGIELGVAYADNAPQILADAGRLQQVFSNVLANAVKFTPSGGRVDVTLERTTVNELTISIRDSGIGISPRFLPFVFDRFRQADSSPTRVHDGLGLGLAIVKSLVEMHGGRVSVASEGEGRGSTFSITLPAMTASTTALPHHPDSSSTLALSGVSVLLVEDEDDTRYMLSAALQSFGASVMAVRSVHAALEMLRTAAPHVVLSDIGMPGEDGFGLILKIRGGEVERLRDVPAIALTAYASPEDRQRILESGYGWHLAKPVDPVMVVKTVRDATGR